MKNLAHSASLDSEDKDAPSKPGIKHQAPSAAGAMPDRAPITKIDGHAHNFIAGQLSAVRFLGQRPGGSVLVTDCKAGN
ncbi:hypothetical protein J3P71_21195 [Rhizobium leguminosarum]|uniref:hypothetical protein n=1 Tax=Rhizobium leguminosarum TaxID=384 RepID=UPI00143F0BFB|nr:hypothetical protein [Rhizobium leguminosarum]MBY5774885.1 hypothetical protein [Rhizobium leguminosarum]MBY5840982.1 hypothetical protein [Rhizobium leguminosarum]MBY5869260.1 hypothetical protein [Rhizobium leguminosarum]NKM09419.1 hypothetical protein [Rhizobium leguminosarum bv. viciae]NKM65527.1 hypothetical protein [Rhizobium leguminosarum bv. viciae]